ncbi:hypothetical protein OAC35_00990 [Flavobacteriaceae bacterium]|nr:hypothetical protein [Flavobacteriaceae bacterium]MDB4092796.1 hypothetical protein [Flavobacteriaceae bacterium]MDB9794029.1 hypothetical protein [Flavobacteriaceae bacterium]MDB9853110.1 hypothetical protein [Flavobacteriaceae bacterium]MDB9995226.1 hypothetical protein [Flavobacteriaceae bacterium]
MRNINTLILFFLISSQLSFSQDYGVSTDDLFSGGNVLLRKLMKKDFSEAEGSPYLDKNFRNGKIIFNNGKTYDVLTRLNVGTQKFEIKKDESSQPSIIELNSSVKIEMNGNTYKSYSINLNKKEIIAVLEDCIELDNISLYYFPRKVIKMPIRTGAVAPSSGSSSDPKPKWANANEFLIYKDDKWQTVPTSFKKLIAKNIFDQKLLKKYKKANKLNLKKRESLIELVSYFNSI